MNVAAFKQSNFLTRADVGAGALVTIRDIHQENVAKAGAPEELRWCISFDEFEKPMVCNATNAAIIASVLKSDETDNWVGGKIVLYDDPNVSFGGKLVGGIRVRAPRGQAAAKPAPVPKTSGVPTPKPRPAPAHIEPVPEEAGDDDVPF